MKYSFFIKCMAIVCILTSEIKAQSSNPFSRAAYIEPYKLDITYNKTTNLVFPAAITTIDRGSQEILVQKAKGVENILRVKADVKNFAETNLSVITSDGKLYSFVVNYTSAPTYLNINVAKAGAFNLALTDSQDAPVNYTEPVVNKSLLQTYANELYKKRSNLHAIHNIQPRLSASLNALYIKDNVLFCRLLFINTSNINFDVDLFHFYISDKKRSKRTSNQEVEITPLYISGDTAMIRNNLKAVWIVALPKLTLANGKILNFKITEKDGGRNLNLKIKKRDILKAKSF